MSNVKIICLSCEGEPTFNPFTWRDHAIKVHGAKRRDKATGELIMHSRGAGWSQSSYKYTWGDLEFIRVEHWDKRAGTRGK